MGSKGFGNRFREVSSMDTSYAATQPFQLDTSFLTGGLKRIQGVFASAEMTRLTRMRQRKASASECAEHNESLFHLRSWSKHRRVEECRARSHWFNRVLPMYEAPFHTQFLPTAGQPVEYWLQDSNRGNNELRIAAFNEGSTRFRLPGPTSRAIAS